MRTELVITGKEFLDALAAAGVIADPYDGKTGRDERIHRVVIDAEVGEPVLLYVERYGDERLLRVAGALAPTVVVDERDLGASPPV